MESNSKGSACRVLKECGLLSLDESWCIGTSGVLMLSDCNFPFIITRSHSSPGTWLTIEWTMSIYLLLAISLCPLLVMCGPIPVQRSRPQENGACAGQITLRRYPAWSYALTKWTLGKFPVCHRCMLDAVNSPACCAHSVVTINWNNLPQFSSTIHLGSLNPNALSSRVS